jgi:hypothetical protein
MNHFRKFASKMTPIFYKIIKSELRIQSSQNLPGTNRPSPICLQTDKYTANLRTLNIVSSSEYRGGFIFICRRGEG